MYSQLWSTTGRSCLPSEHIRLNILAEAFNSFDAFQAYFTTTLAFRLHGDHVISFQVLVLGGEQAIEQVGRTCAYCLHLIKINGPSGCKVLSAGSFASGMD
jgi:hypothetical protein